jgi:integrase
MGHVIEEYLEHLETRGCSPATLRTYRSHLDQLARHSGRGPRHWRRRDIEAWLLDCRRRGDRPATRANKLAAVHGILRWLTREDRIPGDPSAGVESPRVPKGMPRPAPSDAVERLLAHPDARVRVACALAAYGGLRRAEVAALKWTDLSGDSIYVAHGKGDRARVVPLHPRVVLALRGLNRTGVYVLTSRAGHGYCPDGLGALLQPALRAAGLPRGQGLHALRHYFGTAALAASGNLAAVQVAMGHTSPEVTRRYAAVADGAVRAAVLGVA